MIGLSKEFLRVPKKVIMGKEDGVFNHEGECHLASMRVRPLSSQEKQSLKEGGWKVRLVQERVT